MKVEFKNPRILKITLSKEDLEKYNMSYDKLDSSDKKTIDFLHSIINRVSILKNNKSSKLYIDAYPDRNEGCILYVAINESFSINKTFNTPMIVKLKNLDNLIDITHKLFNENLYMIVNSTLYNYENSFYLSIYTYCKMEKSLENIIKEYGTLIGKGSIFSAFFKEHSTEIISENAIEKLYKYLN